MDPKTPNQLYWECVELLDGLAEMRERLYSEFLAQPREYYQGDLGALNLLICNSPNEIARATGLMYLIHEILNNEHIKKNILVNVIENNDSDNMKKIAIDGLKSLDRDLYGLEINRFLVSIINNSVFSVAVREAAYEAVLEGELLYDYKQAKSRNPFYDFEKSINQDYLNSLG